MKSESNAAIQVIDLSHISEPIMAAKSALLEAAGIHNWQEVGDLEIKAMLPIQLTQIYDLFEFVLKDSYHNAYAHLTKDYLIK